MSGKVSSAHASVLEIHNAAIFPKATAETYKITANGNVKEELLPVTTPVVVGEIARIR